MCDLPPDAKGHTCLDDDIDNRFSDGVSTFLAKISSVRAPSRAAGISAHVPEGQSAGRLICTPLRSVPRCSGQMSRICGSLMGSLRNSLLVA